MSAKTPIASDDGFTFYHESFLDDKISEVIISTTNPSNCSIERISTGDITACISLSSKNMDKIAIAWIKERKLHGIFGGPVGEEYGSLDCSYE